jgi:L-alanine-DL-glutamate epimerase-like enolase superfamily enzyme
MRIDRIEIFVTNLPSRYMRRTAGSSSDTGASGDLMGKPILVKIHAEGVVGYGQVRPTGRNHFLSDTSLSVVATIRDYYGPRLIGADLEDFELLWSDFNRILPRNGAARAVLDYAMHDALGKGLGVPVHTLLGGRAQPVIPLEWSVSLADSHAALIADCRRAIDEFGIRNLSLKAGGPDGGRADVEMVAAVRAAVGPDIVLGLDANMGWTVPEAIRALSEMLKHDISYVEQPIISTDLAGLALVRAAVGGVAIIADEGVHDAHDVVTIAAAGAADAVCLKLVKVGGMRQARKITAVAEACNRQVNLGGTAIMSQLEAAAIAHYYASVPKASMLAGGEFVFGLGGVLQDPLVPETDFVIGKGEVAVPMSPGLGVTVDEAALKQHTLLSEVVKGKV